MRTVARVIFDRPIPVATNLLQFQLTQTFYSAEWIIEVDDSQARVTLTDRKTRDAFTHVGSAYSYTFVPDADPSLIAPALPAPKQEPAKMKVKR